MWDINFSYIYTVARGISLSIVSTFQTIMFCPRISWWMEFRNRSPKYIGFCSFLSWILQLLVNVYIPIKVIDPINLNNESVKINYRYCSSIMPGRFISLFHAAQFSSIDVVFGLHYLDWVYGPCPAQAQTTSSMHSQKQTLLKLLPWGQSHKHHPVPGLFLYFYCLSSIFTVLL